MLSCHALVSPSIVAGRSRHQQLCVLVRDPFQKVGRSRTPERRRAIAVMRDHDVISSDGVLEAMRCGHPAIVAENALPVCAEPGQTFRVDRVDTQR